MRYPPDSPQHDVGTAHAENPDALTDALSRVLGTLAEPTERLQRLFFDSFDWRLYKAGFVLELLRHHAKQTLSLSRRRAVNQSM